MFTDLNGKKRLKINLHTHTTLSDGKYSPEDTVDIYKAHGYDMLALTDHWHFGEKKVIHGLPILSGCEYNLGGADGASPVFHIVTIAAEEEPKFPREYEHGVPGKTNYDMAHDIIDEIHRCGGLADLAHPAWSINSAEMLKNIPGGFDVTEIYNSVSEVSSPGRAFSDVILDELATSGMYVPMLAVDDTHFYVGEECRGFIMLEEEAFEKMGIVEAIKAGRFYSSMGPEVHLDRVDEKTVRVRCSPATQIVFQSNLVWTPGRSVLGTDITEATYTLRDNDRFVRATVYDRDHRMAWSNFLVK